MAATEFHIDISQINTGQRFIRQAEGERHGWRRSRHAALFSADDVVALSGERETDGSFDDAASLRQDFHEGRLGNDDITDDVEDVERLPIKPERV